MNQLQKVFNYGVNQVRTIVKGEDVWFVAKDVCQILEITNPTMAMQRLDADERTKFNLGRQGETNVVNESGLYELIFGSKKKEARDFKNWIKREVIPSIRKHGGYLTPDKIEEALLNPDTLIQLATNLKTEREKRIAAEQKVEEQKPKVLFADAVGASKTSILVGELAKLLRQNGLETGQKRLFDWLRNNGYLIKRRGTDYNMPTQRSMEMGLFEIKETSINHSDGHISISKTPKVTGRGQVYFINKLLQEECKSS